MSAKLPNHSLFARAAVSSKRVTVFKLASASPPSIAGSGALSTSSARTASTVSVSSSTTVANASPRSQGAAPALSSTNSSGTSVSPIAAPAAILPTGAGALYHRRAFHLWNASTSRGAANAVSLSYHTGTQSTLPKWVDSLDLFVDLSSLPTKKPTPDSQTIYTSRSDPGVDLPLDLWTEADSSSFYANNLHEQPLLTWEQATQGGSVHFRDAGVFGGGNGSGFGSSANPFGGAESNGGFRSPGNGLSDIFASSPPPPNDGSSSKATYSLTGASASTGSSDGGSGGESGGNASTHQIGTISTYPMALSASSSGAMVGNPKSLPSSYYQRADPPVSHINPFMARALSIPRAPKPEFTFDHGAYGIPKRHPLSAPPRKATRSGPGSAMGMLSAAADFLTSPQLTMEEIKAAPPVPAAGQDSTEGSQAASQLASMLPPGHVAGYTPRLKMKGGRKLKLRENGKLVPDRLRSVQVGEDAYFLRPDALGVADGVGGWARRPGANAALYSRLLMHFCAVELSRYDELSRDELAADNGKLLKKWAQIDPVEVMHRAWERCVRTARKEGILGSSTALLALLRGDELRIANLGDCVLLIIRDGDLLFRSTEQQHSFNFPVQLGMMGDTVETVAERIKAAATEQAVAEEAKRNGQTAAEDVDSDEEGLDEPEGELPADASAAQATPRPEPPLDPEDTEWDEPRRDAGRWTVKVQPGDIIILGSDGLVDNLFDEDILEEVRKFAPDHGANAPVAPADDHPGQVQGQDAPHRTAIGSVLPPDFSPQDVSEALCSRAKAVSEDRRATTSPFQIAAQEEGMYYVGGKHDDISVLVAVVGHRSEHSEGTFVSPADTHL
ncbi:protein serine/threonine phosphatase 2C [Tilletiaria anomala UBC 951]|uniref:Protein serine/threonine phosphatase 2C n=1 Tax=Tilletiaria anomala (strain ATCC 24038 / CBS 436.72 / UBC 951) TaxID=1037660 RepID=A0A066W404_TILAU|nr:protein serine/threonine phosphatase 2C [Tilletiaria anomala UBC 951]KDN48441.1 protein serine/threonine phosphatase 2C [Tilletiaria anomala UBC 951]